jgi:hypothetical protein
MEHKMYTINQLSRLVRREREDGSRAARWLPWRLDAEHAVLTHRDHPDYSVSLTQCRSAEGFASVLADMNGKPWVKQKVMGGLVAAVLDIVRPGPDEITTDELRARVAVWGSR